MDDTLYPEHTYVESGFRAVAAWLESEAGLPTGETFNTLWKVHTSGHRGHVFDTFLGARPALLGRVSVLDLVNVYRNHRPSIRLYPGMADILDRAKSRGFCLGIISDGYLVAQTLKVEALGLARWANPILLTDTWGRDFWKPNHRAFQAMEAAFGLNGPALAYIADNPAKDFIAANQRGWITIHLKQHGQIHPVPDHLPPQAGALHQARNAAGLLKLLQNYLDLG